MRFRKVPDGATMLDDEDNEDYRHIGTASILATLRFPETDIEVIAPLSRMYIKASEYTEAIRKALLLPPADRLLDFWQLRTTS